MGNGAWTGGLVVLPFVLSGLAEVERPATTQGLRLRRASRDLDAIHPTSRNGTRRITGGGRGRSLLPGV